MNMVELQKVELHKVELQKVERRKVEYSEGRTFQRSNFPIFENQENFPMFAENWGNFFEKFPRRHFSFEFSMEHLVTYKNVRSCSDRLG